MVKPPTEQEIWNFVSSTHAADRSPLPQDQIVNTWKQVGMPNPYAQGHFRAFMYALNTLLPSQDFPAKGVDLITNVSQSETALFWLREIHTKMTEPIARSPIFHDQSDPNAITPFLIGKYRIHPKMALQAPAPPPDLLPKLMHNWLKDYAKFHDKIKGKVVNPFGVDKELAQEIHRMAKELNLFFCVVQPMSCLNQRMGRFIEWMFRTAWHLPMKYYTHGGDDLRKLPQDLIDFEAKRLPQLLAATKDVRG